MNEKEWLESDLLLHMVDIPKCRDDRKQRLLFCAIARRVICFLPNPEPFQHAIEFCEAWADGDFDNAAWKKLRRDLRKLQDSVDGQDAIQEAGCTKDAVLKHCHSNQPHIKGCWVVDLVRSG